MLPRTDRVAAILRACGRNDSFGDSFYEKHDSSTYSDASGPSGRQTGSESALHRTPGEPRRPAGMRVDAGTSLAAVKVTSAASARGQRWNHDDSYCHARQTRKTSAGRVLQFASGSLNGSDSMTGSNSYHDPAESDSVTESLRRTVSSAVHGSTPLIGTAGRGVHPSQLLSSNATGTGSDLTHLVRTGPKCDTGVTPSGYPTISYRERYLQPSRLASLASRGG